MGTKDVLSAVRDEMFPAPVEGKCNAMFGSLLDTGLRGVGLDVVAVAAVFLILGLVALLRFRKEDIPAIVRALATWWRKP